MNILKINSNILSIVKRYNEVIKRGISNYWTILNVISVFFKQKVKVRQKVVKLEGLKIIKNSKDTQYLTFYFVFRGFCFFLSI